MPEEGNYKMFLRDSKSKKFNGNGMFDIKIDGGKVVASIWSLSNLTAESKKQYMINKDPLNNVHSIEPQRHQYSHSPRCFLKIH